MYGQNQINYINGILNHPAVANSKRIQALRNNLNSVIQNTQMADDTNHLSLFSGFGAFFVSLFKEPYSLNHPLKQYMFTSNSKAQNFIEQYNSNINSAKQLRTQNLTNLINSPDFQHVRQKIDNTLKAENFKKSISDRNAKLVLQNFQKNVQERKDTINKIHEISSLFQQRPQPKRLTVNSKPQALVNAVNKLETQLKGRMKSTAPIARGHDDFFRNILLRSDNA